jgi:periplasmic protein TonB
MFDAIGVSGRTQKPWTVVVSFIGQVAMVGLAVLIPLIGTERLPQGHSLGDLFLPPEPPRALPHHPPQAANAKPNTMVPPQFTPKGLVLPARIPEKPMMIQDPEFEPAATVGAGVPGGFGDSMGHGGIDSLLATGPAEAPPLTPVVKEPDPSGQVKRIQVGGKVEEGRLISGPRPVYPPIARQARVSGTVRLEAVISRDGSVLNLRAVNGPPLLIPAAVAAVQKWVFRPTYLNGEAVEVATQIDVNFVLN